MTEALTTITEEEARSASSDTLLQRAPKTPPLLARTKPKPKGFDPTGVVELDVRVLAHW